MNIIFLSLISTIFFSLISSSIFLFGEEYIVNYFKNNFYDDEIISQLFTNGFSDSFAIFFTMTIKYYLEKHYKIIENPFIDYFGVIIGAAIVIIFYYVFLLKKNDKNCDNKFTKQENQS